MRRLSQGGPGSVGLRRRLRLAVLGVGGAALLAGALLCAGPPRLTWINDGLRVDYPWPRALAALAAAAGAAVLAASLRRAGVRVAFALLSLAALAVATHRFRYTLEVGGDGIVESGLTVPTKMGWGDVGRVDSRGGDLTVTAASGARVAVSTRGWPPHEVAQLERTIARRVREAAR
jgi:hypothetical protein